MMMEIDPLILEVHQKRALKIVLATLARCLIVSNFLADALHTYHHWHLERIALTMSWHCSYWVAGVYISLLAMAQVMGSLFLVVLKRRFLATGVLWLAAHLRMAANPVLWSLPRYMELCGLISAILMLMLKSRRQAVESFLLITYLNCKDLDSIVWHIVYKYFLRLLLVFVMVRFRVRLSTGLLVLLLALHSMDKHMWSKESFHENSLAMRDLKRFHFWNKVSLTGGLILTAVSTRFYFIF
ncbi:uncharacterized protein LOC108087954 [Drosophila ficusphila]|uniref:uncharacterized protein LOC108087954 n=1 Tax=Drosophila ficusphila TaxID=30025 RepID=UPI0007E768FF|nr:uncharacterized protein LOC108087954 [Drosophila ficusphila]